MKWLYITGLILMFPLMLKAGWDRDILLIHTEAVVNGGNGEAQVEIISNPADTVHIVSLKYLGDEPVDAEAGLVTLVEPPEAIAVHGARLQLIWWTEAFWRKDLRRLPKHVQYLLWQTPEGGYGVMIPLVGGGMRSIIQGRKGRIAVVSSSYDSRHIPEQVPVFAIGWGDDPYALTREVYEAALMHSGATGKLRWQKPYPEVFRYLGWCSWNSHYRDITEDNLVEHAASFKDAGVPVRWMLFDDGWQSVDVKNNTNLIPRALHFTSFDAVPERFPQGLGHTIDLIKNDYGIEWVGVWHTFQGYWDGVLLDSELGREYKDALMPYSDKAAIPDPRDEGGMRFFDDWYRLLREAGVDFTKVDNQSTYPKLIRDKAPIDDAMAQHQRNLQVPSQNYFNAAMINCMEMNVHVVYHWWATNVGRTSNDYIPVSYNNPRAHVLHNVYNAMWFTMLSYPDYDMFKTHDQHPDMHTVARAISGGPVYFTDKAGRERFEYLEPLALSDGSLLMVDSPGLPTRDCLFIDPRSAKVPLKAFTRSGKAGIVAAWNVNYLELPVKGAISPADVEGLNGETFAVYDRMQDTVQLMHRNDKLEIKLGRFEPRVFVIAPIENGYATLGLVDKFISPAAVVNEDLGSGAMILLADGGIFGAYCATRPTSVIVNQEELLGSKIEYQQGLLKLDLDDMKARTVTIELRW